MSVAYDRVSFADSLRAVGLREGDVVFSHSNIGYYGYPVGGRSVEAAGETILGAFVDVLGPSGTLVVPTFTYSFAKGEVFDVQNTPGSCGVFTEAVRTSPGAMRSADPMFSVTAVGAQAAALTSGISVECFGEGSVWDRLFDLDALICNLNLDAASTFIHFVERRLSVPYRYDKLFTGWSTRDGEPHKDSVLFFCQDASNAETVAYFERFDELARSRGIVASTRVGRGGITAIRARASAELITDELHRDPWFLTEAHRLGTTPKLVSPLSEAQTVPLSADASMFEIVEALWEMPRELVSDGYDSAIASLAKITGMKVHAYRTGTHCWSWVVPEKWTCRSATLAEADGTVLLDYAENPLHVVSYSKPFSGTVSRETLLEHLYVHDVLPDAVPYVFKPYERVWGLCASRDLRDSLAEGEYRVEIDTSYSCGELKVGELIVEGERPETIVLCAHLCHTRMANDDLTGVAVGIEVMRRLAQRPRKYSYRLLVVPETVGSVAWLANNEEAIPDLLGGLFLEMLGRDAPHALQTSFVGDDLLDRTFIRVLERSEPEAWTGAYRTVIVNDEAQFNAPGVRVPMLSLSRVDHRESATWPYSEYHSDKDDMSLVSQERMADSVDMVMRMIEALEGAVFPANVHRGELFASRFGVHVDYYANPEGNERLLDLLQTIDGTHSIEDLQQLTRLSPLALRGVLDELHAREVIVLEDVPRRVGPVRNPSDWGCP